MSKKEVELEGIVDMDQAIDFVDGLLAGMKSGTIYLEKGNETLVLCPEEEVEIEIKGSQKKGKGKISFELSWEKEEIEQIPEPVEFRIYSDTPEPEIAAAAEEEVKKSKKSTDL